MVYEMSFYLRNFLLRRKEPINKCLESPLSVERNYERSKRRAIMAIGTRKGSQLFFRNWTLAVGKRVLQEKGVCTSTKTPAINWSMGRRHFESYSFLDCVIPSRRAYSVYNFFLPVILNSKFRLFDSMRQRFSIWNDGWSKIKSCVGRLSEGLAIA